MAPFGETAETVEEKRSDEERSSCSGCIVDEDTIQPARLLPIFEGDMIRSIFAKTYALCITLY